jgi:hypothetical protein
MSAGNDPERIVVEKVTMLVVAAEVLQGVVKKLAAATVHDMPILATQAKTSVERVVGCCADTAQLDQGRALGGIVGM